MKVADKPEDEFERLEALDALHIVYSPAEERFDRITRLAKRHFNVPIVLISLVSSEIQWFKSCQGISASETPREVSFCSHALLIDMPLVINDTHKYPEFADNPLVTNEPHIRFYAGHTIKHMGKKIGTLCVIDTKPREFTVADMDSLKSLACWVEIELENTYFSDTVKQLIQNNTQKQRKKLIDPLTGAWNQYGITKLLKQRFADKSKQQMLSIMKVGLDERNETPNPDANFKFEILLMEVAQRIRSVLTNENELAHTDNEEFIVVMDQSNKTTARMTAQNILRGISAEPFYLDGNTIRITASIGIACSEDVPNGNWRELLEMAESALYDAHVDGGNRSILAGQTS